MEDVKAVMCPNCGMVVTFINETEHALCKCGAVIIITKDEENIEDVNVNSGIPS